LATAPKAANQASNQPHSVPPPINWNGTANKV
jgi:hypothetical protein